MTLELEKSNSKLASDYEAIRRREYELITTLLEVIPRIDGLRGIWQRDYGWDPWYRLPIIAACVSLSTPMRAVTATTGRASFGAIGFGATFRTFVK